MPIAERWLSSEELADLAQITSQAARKVLGLARQQKPWRGVVLVVRPCLGQGGRRGLRYETAWSSLPASLQQERTDHSPGLDLLDGEPTDVAAAAENQGGRIAERWRIIQEALALPLGSSARARAVAAAAVASLRSERTLYNWIHRYEAHGLRGLARARHADAGHPRVYVSRPFDKAAIAAGLGEHVLRSIACDLERSIKGLWASRAEQAGATEIRRLAEFLLLEACEVRKLQIDRSAIRLSRRYVERFANYRVVNQRRNDRKAFDDAKPRIRRDWTALAPMERVVADVKHLDVIVTRVDGSPAWPKIVAFMDAGTGRVFVHPVLLDRGEGVRQEHVIEGFLAMVSAPSWGFPQGLYLDNGSEFAALIKIDGALQLLNDPGVRTIIFAQPYNASAKPIESLFARLDRYVFSMMPGYAGPNRLNKKTQTVGRPPTPYPGSWDDFCSMLGGLIAAHNQRPVGGPWKDLSPESWFQEKREQGWRPVLVDGAALDAAFSDHDSRRVDRGVIRVKGERFSHPSLAALPSRTIVDVALPWRRGAEPLAKAPGGAWIYLQREVLYPARWIEGAKESTRRQNAQARHVAALARDAPTIDPVALKIRSAAHEVSPAPTRGPPSLDLGATHNDLAQAAKDHRFETQKQPSRQELIRAREMAITEQLERRQQDDQ